MLGDEAEIGRLLVGRVDWPTSNSFPRACKETQGSVNGQSLGQYGANDRLWRV